MPKPFIIGTPNAREALHIGVEVIGRGGSAMDAVEAVIRAVEADPPDATVGLGGVPNLLGVPQLDASIMDGRSLRAGAVAAVEGFRHPLSIARRVLEASPHVLLVGPGAELFARAMGFERVEPPAGRGRVLYEAFLRDALGELEESFQESRTQWSDYVKAHRLREWHERLADVHHGTVNVIAVDRSRDICSGVSTSGTALKLPGRAGDSPIIGAGNYCDNRYGAAACTGRGELSIRLSTARTIVGHMERGLGVREACVRALREVHALKEPGGINCLALDARGETISTSTLREPIHFYMEAGMAVPEERRGIWVKPG